MVAPNPAYAPQETGSRSKNRVGGFFFLAADRVGVDRPASRYPRRENGATVTIIVSGRPFWTSADPAGFPDGPNRHFYAPVPTSGLDPLGLETFTDDFGRTGSSENSQVIAIRVRSQDDSIQQQLQNGVNSSAVDPGHAYLANPSTGVGIGYYNANGSQLSGPGMVKEENADVAYTHEMAFTVTGETYAAITSNIQASQLNPGQYNALDSDITNNSENQCVSWALSILEQSGYTGPLLDMNPPYDPFILARKDGFEEI